MGSSIVLDPFDCYQLVQGLGREVQELLQDVLELNVVDGLILPNLKMDGTEEKCVFLNEEGRCSIHPYRPGICRIFPLGRLYENGSFSYFLQTHECPNAETKVKVSKWIDVKQLKKNQKFIADWHYFLRGYQDQIGKMQDDVQIRQINMAVLTTFYLMPYDQETDFYEQFEERKRTSTSNAGGSFYLSHILVHLSGAHRAF